MSYKDILENAITASSFKLEPCLCIESNLSEPITSGLAYLKTILSSKMYTAFKSAVIRSSFFIELTNPTADTDSTKYQVRWVPVLYEQGDVRFASYECCVEICENLINRLVSLEHDQLQTLIDYCSNSIYNFELPIDYKERHAVPFHAASNIDIFISPTIERCTRVRKLIKDPALNPKSDIFKKVISQKIKVKAYQTDRAQTGTHQTNREKRWESHPDNYQFAFRRDCNDVETSLILQVCMFDGVDAKLIQVLQDNKLLPPSFEKYKCPITGDILVYSEFEQEILNRVHGKSCFQVGHLNPLKATGGHRADNIGWISDDGNRIQGSLSIDEVNGLLKRIYTNRPELRNDL